MKNACLLGTLVLCCQSFFVVLYAQRGNSPQKNYRLLTNDSNLDRSNALSVIVAIASSLYCNNLPLFSTQKGSWNSN